MNTCIKSVQNWLNKNPKGQTMGMVCGAMAGWAYDRHGHGLSD
jgi:hypothetical protein